MHSLSQSRPLILVTIGPPGSGKSFFARQFAETFNAPLISFDEIRTHMFGHETSHDSNEDLVVARIAGMQLRELLRTKKTIIIDGGHNPKVSRNELQKIAQASGYRILNIWLQTDERTARIRATRRSSSREDDRFNRSLDDDEFLTHAKRFTAPSRFESVVVVSGRHTYPTQARVVLKKLVVPHDPIQTKAPRRPESDTPPVRRSVAIN